MLFELLPRDVTPDARRGQARSIVPEAVCDTSDPLFVGVYIRRRTPRRSADGARPRACGDDRAGPRPLRLFVDRASSIAGKDKPSSRKRFTVAVAEPVRGTSRKDANGTGPAGQDPRRRVRWRRTRSRSGYRALLQAYWRCVPLRVLKDLPEQRLSDVEIGVTFEVARLYLAVGISRHGCASVRVAVRAIVTSSRVTSPRRPAGSASDDPRVGIQSGRGATQADQA